MCSCVAIRTDAEQDGIDEEQAQHGLSFGIHHFTLWNTQT